MYIYQFYSLASFKQKGSGNSHSNMQQDGLSNIIKML